MSFLIVADQSGLGVFYTVLGDEEARLALADWLFERLDGSPCPEPVRMPLGPEALGPYAGTYRYDQYNRNTFTKLQSLFVGQVRVRAEASGNLTVTALMAGDVYGGFEGTSHWMPIAPDVFQRVDGEARISFDRDASGRVSSLHSSMRYHGSFTRIPMLLASPAQLAYLAMALLLNLGVAVVALALPALGMAAHAWPFTLLALYAALTATFCALLIPSMFLIGNVGGGFPAYGFGINGWIRGTLTLPLLASPLAPGLVAGGVALALRGTCAPAILGAYGILTLLAILHLAWLRHWNLLGYRY